MNEDTRSEAWVEESARRQFTVVSCLGRGGFGEVYRALMASQGGLEADVALKVLRRDIDPRGQAVQRLRDEGRLLARLNHPTILRVHDLVVLEGRISLITEFVDGEDLATLFKGDDRIGVRALLEAIGHVASALDAAWNTPLGDGSEAVLELVHRDIKPSNIRVSRHGEVKLLDFGIARTDAVGREARTQTEMMVGSPAYMAPERYLNAENRPESDVFSLGSTLYEGIAGKRFFKDMPVPMLASLAVNKARYAEFLEERLARLQSDVPEPVIALLRDTLAYAPSDRPSSGALAGRCEALADELSGPSLGRFCQDRAWRDAPVEEGELDGRTLTEGTMARARGEPVARLPEPVAPAPAPVRRGVKVGTWLGLGTAGVVLTAILAIFGFLGGGLLVMGALRPEPVAVTPIGAAPPEPTTAPEVDAPADPEPAPGDADADEPVESPGEPSADPAQPDAGTEAPDPEPVVAPAPKVGAGDAVPVPPSVAPKPARPAPVASSGHVRSGGDAPVELEAGGVRHALPADLPAGTYTLYARYHGREPVAAGTLEVRAGASHEVVCRSRLFRCDIR